MTSRLNSAWVQLFKSDPEKLKEFETYFLNSNRLINALMEIIRKKKEILDRKELTEDMYDSPSWAAKQAHMNGAKAELRFIESLFQLKEIQQNDPV